MSQSESKPATASGRRGAIVALLPTLLLSVAFPLVVFNLCKSAGMSDLAAYLWAAAGPLIETVGTAIVRRHANFLSLLILALTLVSAVVTVVGDTSPVVLLLKDSVLTGVFGLICLGSLVIGRQPLMFHFTQSFGMAGNPARAAEFERQWDTNPPFRHMFRTITAGWGAGYLLEAALKVVVALTLPFTAAFNINQVSPLVFAVVLAAWTILYVRRTKARGQERRRAAAAAAGQEAGVPSE